MGLYVYIKVPEPVLSADHHISSLIKAIKDNSEESVTAQILVQ